jgi:hypothetical protein
VKSRLASEALFDLLDPGLERSHVLLQLREGALVGEPRLDPAQGLRDRVVLLLEGPSGGRSHRSARASRVAAR